MIPARTSANRDRIIGALALVVLSFSFTLSYWDRFLAPSSAGAFFYVAEQIQAGRVPYRDFFFVAPPLHALKLAALMQMFGHTFLVTRFDALVERTVLALVTFIWLSRIVRNSAAFCGAFLALVIFAGDPADALASYHHDSVFWAVLAGFSASFAIDGGRSPRTRGGAGFLAGVFAGCCILTKQTTGLGILAAIPVTVGWLYWRAGSTRHFVRFVMIYAVGWAVPVAFVLGWLQQQHALSVFFGCVFGNTSAKGSGWSLFLRPIVQLPAAFVSGVILTGLIAVAVRRCQQKQAAVWSTVIYAMSAVVLVVVVLTGGPASLANAARVTRTFVILGSLVGSCGVLLWSCFLAEPSFRTRQITLLASVAVAIGYMLSLSWAAYEPMVMPGIALVVALVLHRALVGTRMIQVASVLVYLLLLSMNVSAKLKQPFGWLGWNESAVTAASSSSRLPQLAGLRISRPTLDIAESVTDLIVRNSRPDEPVLVYPYLPSFYVLSNRRPQTYAFTHYLDVAPDAICQRDAVSLLQNRPKVMVVLDDPPDRRLLEETVFRAGRPSGSRAIVDAIGKLSQTYRLLASFHVPDSGGVLRVWVRD